ncbi:copper amine oxidase N-terminal domain-containing protein [Paenibacillus sp. MMS18-CY102]|uniref:copper amine oxidase N-terminal domain-containing protein n=1 Tax=Paenibacillus sp. MMS18-CY102 TaxID=2682849 RepID=UPI001F3B6706|nr:copper amine oxidase N-terminal domain-containing protein [Paenibacillus sp. MMS18-CY102]
MLVSVAAIATFALQGAASVSAHVARTITVNINGAFISTDSSPFIDSGRVMVPLRTLASLGLTYVWDAASHTAEITNASHDVVKVTEALSTAYINGQATELDVPANNYGGRIMVPARFVSEAFGFKVKYEKTRGILFVKDADYRVDASKLASADLKEARLAAISLPIAYSFIPASKAESDQYEEYSYTFASGDASRYTYATPIATTLVEVKDGVARAVWQFKLLRTHSADVTLAGSKPSYDVTELYGTYFGHKSNGKNEASYIDKDGDRKWFAFSMNNYGDIIQAIPED